MRSNRRSGCSTSVREAELFEVGLAHAGRQHLTTQILLFDLGLGFRPTVDPESHAVGWAAPLAAV